jgi:hypothetical protein
MTVRGKFTKPSSSWRSQQRFVFRVVATTICLRSIDKHGPEGFNLASGIHALYWIAAYAGMTTSRFLRQNDGCEVPAPE